MQAKYVQGHIVRNEKKNMSNTAREHILFGFTEIAFNDKLAKNQISPFYRKKLKITYRYTI